MRSKYSSQISVSNSVNFVPVDDKWFLSFFDRDNKSQRAEAHCMNGVRRFASLVSDFSIKFSLSHWVSPKKKPDHAVRAIGHGLVKLDIAQVSERTGSGFGYPLGSQCFSSQWRSAANA